MDSWTRVPRAVDEDAAEWFARLQTENTSDATRHEFAQWLTRSPVHIEEFLRVSALHRALSSELKTESGWLEDVLAEASLPGGNVVHLPIDEQESTAAAPAAARRRRRFFLAAAAAAVLALGIGLVVGIDKILPGRDGATRIATEIGEQRWVVLADGSDVQLNTNTEIRVRMSDELRMITLVRGEAIFDVQKDPARPFRVESDTALVEAVGTRFNVYRQREQTVVTVVEGRVVVSPLAGSASPGQATDLADPNRKPVETESVGTSDAGENGEPLQLDAGHRATVTKEGRIIQPEPADIERATDWTRRRMVFDSDTLETVVAEFNRYNRNTLVIADANLKTRLISGVFNIDDPEAFLALLKNLDEIHVEERADGSRVIRRVGSGTRS